MSGLLLLPVLVPLAAAALGFAAWRAGAVQRLAAIIGAVLLLVSGVALLVVVERDGIQTIQLGGWPAPFGIVFAVETEMGIPVKLVGVGETIGDLMAFDPDDFVSALFEG